MRAQIQREEVRIAALSRFFSAIHWMLSASADPLDQYCLYWKTTSKTLPVVSSRCMPRWKEKFLPCRIFTRGAAVLQIQRASGPFLLWLRTFLCQDAPTLYYPVSALEGGGARCTTLASFQGATLSGFGLRPPHLAIFPDPPTEAILPVAYLHPRIPRGLEAFMQISRMVAMHEDRKPSNNHTL
jgi:hypothetical protein